MVVGGCDVGSAAGKAVVMIDGVISGASIVPSTTDPGLTARLAMEDALNKAGLSSINDLAHVVGTGYGRLRVPFADENISDHLHVQLWDCMVLRVLRGCAGGF